MEATSQSTPIGGKKHQWTSIEDLKLVECLIEMCNSGRWKADNVYGKDRATGDGAMGFSETLDEIAEEINNGWNDDYDPFDTLDEMNANASMNNNIPSSQTTRKAKRKSNNRDPLVELLSKSMQEFSTMQASASNSIRKLADCFQHEADSAARRMNLYEEIKKVDGLTNSQRLKIGKLLVSNQPHIDYFFTLEEELGN
uniref:Myb/SANT-like domain-containing protein n=1 Tax=Cannabis sativa TaxID=3483 RepID=A0A803QHQ2_CANSA